MFKHIYDFAVKNNISNDTYKYQKLYVRWHVVLSEHGELVGFEENEDKKQTMLCPQYLARATMGTKAHFLVEKSSIIFNKNHTKHEDYMSDLKDASEISPECKLIYELLQNEEFLTNPQVIKISQTECKVSFKIQDKYIENIDSWKPYFEAKYDQVAEKTNNKNKNCKMVSAITGDIIEPVTVVDKIKVPGVTDPKGDAIISCKQASFESYGLEKAMNGAISEREMKIINEGLEYLLTNNYQKKWNLVVWYDSELNTSKDPIQMLFGPNESFLADIFDTDMDNEHKREKEEQMYEYLHGLLVNGKLTQDFTALKGRNYYSFNYKSCGGRSSFSNFKIKNLDDLFQNTIRFYDDSLIKRTYFIKDGDLWNKKSVCYPIFNIYAILINCAMPKKEQDGRIVPAKFEQIEKEFNTTQRQLLLNAITSGSQIPLIFCKKALANIKKYILANQAPPAILYQLLKVYVNRSEQQKGETTLIMPTLNTKNKSVAYNLGRLLCVYEKIQEEAMKDVNTTIVDRFYSSASTSPAYVFGKLATTANYHFRKIDNQGLVKYYKKMLNEIAANIESFPKTLSIVEQSDFALGFYQQEQSLYEKKTNNEE